jgi:hypothetical protein
MLGSSRPLLTLLLRARRPSPSEHAITSRLGELQLQAKMSRRASASLRLKLPSSLGAAVAWLTTASMQELAAPAAPRLQMHLSCLSFCFAALLRLHSLRQARLCRACFRRSACADELWRCGPVQASSAPTLIISAAASTRAAQASQAHAAAAMPRSHLVRVSHGHSPAAPVSRSLSHHWHQKLEHSRSSVRCACSRGTGAGSASCSAAPWLPSCSRSERVGDAWRNVLRDVNGRRGSCVSSCVLSVARGRRWR